MIQKKESEGHITAYGRKHLQHGQFALPAGEEEKKRGIGGRYPIDTISRARNALARGAQNASPEELAEIRRKVHAKYPQISIAGK